MNLGELAENGQLKIVKNANELYDIWDDIKEDELLKEFSESDKDMTVNM